MKIKKDIAISVITATYNSEKTLKALIQSLRAQTDPDFEWVVVDGGSTDNTLSLLEECKDLNLVISSQKDFGIYDALNRGLRIMNGEYYIVIGSDDFFFKNAIEFFKRAIEISSADIIAAKIVSNGKVVRVRESQPSWFGVHAGFITSHSVGSAFKRNLHEKFGFYSKTLPIAADALFIKKARLGGASHFLAPFVAGEFSSGGLSSMDIAGILTEFFRVQVATENKFIQTFIFILRLLKNYKRL